jgi:hypothetical protein
MSHQNCLAIRNTANVTGGKPIADSTQSISSVSAINPLVAFYDIHGRNREVLFFYSVPDTTQDSKIKSSFLGKLLVLALVAFAHGTPDLKVELENQNLVKDDACPAIGHWLLPHEYDCTKFYYCEYGMRRELPTDCALGSEFSFALQVLRIFFYIQRVWSMSYQAETYPC